MDITPEFSMKIATVRQEYADGKYISLRTSEELEEYIKSL
jgi:hypothetical protein